MRRRQQAEKKHSNSSTSVDEPENGISESTTTKDCYQSWPSLLWSRFLFIFKWLCLILIIPPFLNFAALQKEYSQLLSQYGQLYDVGKGQKMFMSCQGKGIPTVLLDAPTGQSSDVWLPIQERVGKLTKVCIYDRAGLGLSDRPVPVELNMTTNKLAGAEYTVERMVDDLRSLITQSSQQPKPFILVGAEIGALVARFYSHIYESDVSDLVLIDPLAESLFSVDDGIWTNFWFSQLIGDFQMLQLGAACGLNRIALILGLVNVSNYVFTTENNHSRQKFFLCHPRHLSSAVDEHYFINQSMSQINTLRMMKQFPSNISVTVLNGNYYDERLPSVLNKAWAKSQQHLLNTLHPNAKHLVINGADRSMIHKSPEIIAETIIRTVKRTRSKVKSNSK